MSPAATSFKEESFVTGVKTMASLLGEEDATVIVPKKGDVVSGVVMSMAHNKILVDIGSMYTGLISGTEVQDSSSTAKHLKVGDVVKTLVIGEENDSGQFILSLKQASQETTWDTFVELYKTQETTTVKMYDANKGGLLVEQDGIRGFIPVSQLTPEHYPRVSGADPEKILARLQQLVGTDLIVKVINIDFADRRLILSEKAAYSDKRQGIIDELKVGQTIKGTVSGVVNFGIFVNYKGVEGLVHISEIAWGHVTAPNEYAKVSDTIEVLVIGIEGDKVSFSMKRLVPDPWVEKSEKYAVGEVVKGVVTRIEPFGAFVKLDDEIDGLIHISELSAEKEVKDPTEIVHMGDAVEAKVISIDLNEHRLGLSIKALTVSAPTVKAVKAEDVDSAPKESRSRKAPKAAVAAEDEIAAESEALEMKPETEQE